MIQRGSKITIDSPKLDTAYVEESVTDVGQYIPIKSVMIFEMDVVRRTSIEFSDAH